MISPAAVKQLQADKNEIAAKIQELQAEASKIDAALASLTGSAVSGAVSKPAKKKYVMTAAHKAALVKARAARWAKVTPAKATVAKPAKKKRTMSAAAKAKISAFQKKLWAERKAKSAKK